MIYSNSDSAALMAMERERTGNYGDTDDFSRVCYHCSECGDKIYEDERYYEFDGEIICDSCIESHERTAEWEG